MCATTATKSFKDRTRNITFKERDKLSKTVTEVSQKTIAKAKELADTSRLNSMISEEEKVIANQYFQIGKLYVSVHKDDFEDDFAGMIGAIAEAEAKIKDFKMQIQDIKGVQRCEKCGAEVPNGLVELPCRESEFRFPMIA